MFGTALCYFMLHAGFKMMRLEGRRAALAASVLAMLVPPGNLVGLPLGLWALRVLKRREVQDAFAARRASPAPVRPHAVWPWVGAAVGMILLVPFVIIALNFLTWQAGRHEAVKPQTQALEQARYQSGKAAVESPNRVLEVRCEDRKATIKANLDYSHELRLFIGGEPLGWSARSAGSASLTATVGAYGPIHLDDGSMGWRLAFETRVYHHYIAITPDGPVPYGEVVFRPDAQIANENGTFTFADIRQTNGTLIPVSIHVRPVFGKSSDSRSFGPVIERMAVRGDQAVVEGQGGAAFGTRSQQIGSATEHNTGSGPPLSSPLPRPLYLPREAWTNAGASTWAAALQTFVWALRENDYAKLKAMAWLPPTEEPGFQKEAARFFSLTAQCRGIKPGPPRYFRPDGHEMLNSDLAHKAKIYVVFEGVGNERSPSWAEFKFLRTDSGWKYIRW